eukprot:gene9698-8651_t
MEPLVSFVRGTYRPPISADFENQTPSSSYFEIKTHRCNLQPQRVTTAF